MGLLNGEKYQFIFAEFYEIWGGNWFLDFYKTKDIICFPAFRYFNNKITQRIGRAIFNSNSKKPGGLYKYPIAAKYLAPFFYNLHNYPFHENMEYIILLPSTTIWAMDLSYFKKLKKNGNIHLIPVLIDSMDAHSSHLNRVRDKLFSSVWDYVLTYDRYDAKKYGFKWFGYSYYSIQRTNEIKKIKSDIYFIGQYKTRKKEIRDIYRYLTKNNIIADFDVVTHDKDEIQLENTDLLLLHNNKDYMESLNEIFSSNCILEILQDGQKTQSVRYFEAVIYNKKLLTNNPNISSLPFYNSRYMKYFKNLEDIDCDWIRKREEINYQYNNEFSPIHLIDFVKQLYNID